jgi:putative AbiEii toxin of type IV toxin-antitoxin system
VWNFETTDLGKVSRAKISMAPLVLLVGKNNTGKSYIAMLLWALSNAHMLFRHRDAYDRSPDWCKGLIAKMGQKETTEIDVTESLANTLVDYFNSELAQNGAWLLRDVFAYDGFGQTSVRVEADQPFVPFTMRLGPVDRTIDTLDKDRLVRINIRDNNASHLGSHLLRKSDEQGLIAELFYRVLFGPKSRRPILYIPAARTGLMLSLGAMITKSLVEDSSPTAGLPRPLRTFIGRLTVQPRPRPPHARGLIAEWLQDKIVHGKIERNVGEVPSYTYVPENTSMSVPLHAASSMITELAPFLLLLKQDPQARQIIFEEPEAHLHISAQRSMARALARLINLGANVLVTSHSDTFVQQINNLMHLYNHPQKAELMKTLGYEEDDLIDPEKAKAYEFSERGGKTDVTEVKKEIEGFIVPSLNDTLINLANETITLQDSEE